MKRFLLAAGLALLATAMPPASSQTDAGAARQRVFVLSDIGNEPDDQMSLVRLLVYSNALDIEGLVATTSTWQKAGTHADTIAAIVEEYGEVHLNLAKHAEGWPDAAALNILSKAFDLPHVKFLRRERGKAVFEVASGRYVFTAQ